MVRAATAVVAIPVVLLANYFGGVVLASLVGLAALVGAVECARLIAPGSGSPLYLLSVPATVVAAVVPALTVHPQAAWIGILIVVLVAAGGYSLLPVQYSESGPGWLLNLVPPLYVGVLLGHMELLRRAHHGARWVALVLLMTWAYDTGAYFAGRSLGRHAFMRHVSPKKTVEGVVGGVLLSTLAGLIAAPGVGLTVPQAALLGLITGVVAQWGDLLESMLKRQSGLKDSGRIVPGHGGLLDRIDSLLLTGVLGYYAALALGYAS